MDIRLLPLSPIETGTQAYKEFLLIHMPEFIFLRLSFINFHAYLGEKTVLWGNNNTEGLRAALPRPGGHPEVSAHQAQQCLCNTAAWEPGNSACPQPP